jgi:hypothetical protein
MWRVFSRASAHCCAFGPITRTFDNNQPAPRSMPLIFSGARCSPKVLNRPGSFRTCTAICSKRLLNTRTSRASQRAHTVRPRYSGGTE